VYRFPDAQAALQNAAATGDQDDQSDDKQNVNQGAGDVQGKAQKPQNHKDDENCPKH